MTSAECAPPATPPPPVATAAPGAPLCPIVMEFVIDGKRYRWMHSLPRDEVAAMLDRVASSIDRVPGLRGLAVFFGAAATIVGMKRTDGGTPRD